MDKGYRHITQFKFKKDINEEEKYLWRTEMKEMLSTYNLNNIQFAKNLSDVTDGFDFEYVLNIEFDDIKKRKEYLLSENHKNFNSKWFDKYEYRSSSVIELN